MTVISIPERFPVISGNKGHQNYRLGERVQLNCTCYDTHPPANLRWFINDRQVGLDTQIRYLAVNVICDIKNYKDSNIYRSIKIF